MRIHHLALRTEDVPGLTTFYRDVVGLPAASDGAAANDGSAWLMAGEARVMIEVRERDEGTFSAGSMELVAFAIVPEDREAIEMRLARAGVAIEARTDFTLYFRDPDGRRVAVSHYPERPLDGPASSEPLTRRPD